MIPIAFNIKYSGPIPRHVRARLRRILKEGYQYIGIFWHRHYRAKHFTREAYQEYYYTPRKGEGKTGKAFWRSYTGRKQRRFGHTRPLVWSGESERASRRRDVRATSKGVKIFIHANKLNFRNPHSNINMREEMTRVSTRERETLVERMAWKVNRDLAAITDKTRVTIQ